MSLKIATWNVNSLRVRLPHVLEWAATAKPDVLALQETKLIDGDFPVEAIREAGYEVVFSGQKTYNGVAILSRVLPQDIVVDLPDMVDPQRRILGVTIGDTRIYNLYIPNGESIESAKYHYKLGWLEKLTAHLQAEFKKHANIIILGDFNIAPEDRDVHNPAEWQGKVLFSEPERSAYQKFIQLGFQDCYRLHTQPEQAFSWWDYRQNSFKRNRGLRIDHILASKPLALKCVQCHIDPIPRGWERPSDHTPVIAEFAT
jgi:exodeoxyribonuclease III